MDTNSFTPEQIKALEVAEKLMRLASKNTNENEAAAAAAKAMAILESLNLDMSIIEQGGTEKIKRSDEKMAGGLYKWQRDLWRALSQLHFCFYWNLYVYDRGKQNKYQSRVQGRRVMGGYKFQHRVVGRTINVIAVRNMAQYLEQTIERLTREHILSPSQYFTNYATSYRSGIADSVISKIYARREQLLSEERRKEQEARDREAQTANSASTSRAITLTSLVKSEQEANYDFLHGDGEWARREERIQRQAVEAKRAEEEYTRWAAEHPEDARKLEEERRKANRSSWNAGTAREKDNRDYSAYRAGREAGRNVSIDQQTDTRKDVRIA